MHHEIETAIAAVLGGGMASAIAKFFVERTFNKIDELPDKIAELKSQLSTICVKLENLERLNILVTEHDRKIIALETKRGNTRRNETNCQA